MTRWLLILLLLAPLSAQELPTQFRGATQPATADSIGNLQWFGIFADPQLNDLLQQAVNGNPDLRIAMERIQGARANLRATGAQQFPSVTVSGDVNYTEVSANSPTFVGNFLPRQRTFAEILLNFLSFELDIWGRLHHQTQAAVAELLATEEDRKTVLTMVVSEVASAYFNLLELDAELELARQTLATRQESLRLIRAREAGGVATLLDVRQGEQLVQQAEQLVPDLERRIEQTENNLNLLLGRLPGPVARGRSLLEQTTLPTVPAGLPSDLLTRRPDIRAAQQRLIAREETVESAERGYFPRFSLTSFFGYQSSSLSNLFTSASRTIGVVPGVVAPVFSAGQYSDVDLAESNAEIARLEYQRALATAFREVSNALVDYQKFREVRERQEQLVGTLEDRRRLAYLRYQGGIDTLLNALDADRELFGARQAVSQSRRNELLALVQLYKALGGGWQTGAEPAQRPEP